MGKAAATDDEDEEAIMALILLFILLMIAIHSKASKLEKVNVPALVSIEMALALPIIAMLVDAAAALRIAAVLPLCVVYVPFMVGYTAVVTILAIVGLAKYRHDSTQGGFLWCVAGLPVAALICMIAVGNFTEAVHAGRIANDERGQQALIQQKRQEAQDQQLLYEPDRQPPPTMEQYSPADKSFSILMPSQVREFACEMEAGKGLVYCVSGEAPMNGIEYCVIYYNQPGGSEGSARIESFIKKELLRNWQGEGGACSTRTATAGNRVYKLMAVGRIKAGSNDINEFFASFKDTRGQ